MNEQQIAITILDQLKHTASMPVLWSWGFNSPIALRKQKIGDRYRLGGLQFKVNGAIFQGIVRVNLMADDTYTIELWSRGKLKKTVENQYCDEFAMVIDRLVETETVGVNND